MGTGCQMMQGDKRMKPVDAATGVADSIPLQYPAAGNAALSRITFLVIGAQKAGTTWLDEALKAHEDIFTPSVKEMHFFSSNWNYAKGLEWYASHFEEMKNERAAGECTPNYLRTVLSSADKNPDLAGNVPERVLAAIPNAKLIVSLRNPVDRAVSAYFHMVTRGKLSPFQRLRDVTDKFGIAASGYYALHLKAWFEFFDQSRFRILCYEEDILPDEAKATTIQSVYRFLGVDDQFLPNDLYKTHNVRQDNALAYLNRIGWLRDSERGRLVASEINRLTPKFVQDSLEIRVEQADLDALAELYAPHNDRLEQLLEREFPW